MSLNLLESLTSPVAQTILPHWSGLLLPTLFPSTFSSWWGPPLVACTPDSSASGTPIWGPTQCFLCLCPTGRRYGINAQLTVWRPGFKAGATSLNGWLSRQPSLGFLLSKHLFGVPLSVGVYLSGS